jgi:crossover junction endodeoxyribonuclease RuvC
MSVYVGIDPGKSGGICVYNPATSEIEFHKMPDTVHGIAELLGEVIVKHSAGGIKLVLEKVHAMPGQGVTSMFTFGQGFGWLEGVIAALGIPCVEVPPQRWMKLIGTMPKDKADRKKFIKDWAEKRSGQTLPLYIADAVAIAYASPTIWGGK